MDVPVARVPRHYHQGNQASVLSLQAEYLSSGVDSANNSMTRHLIMSFPSSYDAARIT